MDIATLFSGYSKALYSTWMLYRPDGLLLDCGEGAATALGNSGYGIERVLLTHGHNDHLAGLPTLLFSRAGGMGDIHKPLTIFHPQNDASVEAMRSYMEAFPIRWPFELRWQPLAAGETFSVAPENSQQNHARHIETFATRHIPHGLTLGYKLVETRRRLKAEFAGKNALEMANIARDLKARFGAQAHEHLNETYRAPLVAWSGDSAPLDASDVRGCEILCHEATLLDAGERKARVHSTLQEAIEVASAASVGALVLYHFSGRYRAAEIKAATQNIARAHGIQFPIWCLVRDRLHKVWNDITEEEI